MDNPLVSIVSPCYNGEDYLERFFETILKQKYKNIELVLINDCSTDKTGEIAESYRKKLSGIRYKLIHLPQNLSASGAVNEGLKHFTGDYVMFPDSDDIMYPNHVMEKVKFLEANKEYSWVACNIRKVHDTNLNKSIGLLQIQHRFLAENIFERLIKQVRVCYTPIVFMFRSSKFLSTNSTREIFVSRAGQNWQLLLPISYRHKCAFLDKVLGDYVVRDNSTSRTENRITMPGNIEARKEILRETINRIPVPNKPYYISMIDEAIKEKSRPIRNKRIVPNVVFEHDIANKDRKILVVGGTGVIGADVTRECIGQGYDTYVLSRGKKERLFPESVKWIVADIKEEEATIKKLEGMFFDVVVDMLVYAPEHVHRASRLFKNKCKHYILLSSATVYSTENQYTDITEKTPLTNTRWSYSNNKIRCEKLLMRDYSKICQYYSIVRPYITYGETRIPFALIDKNNQWTLVDRIMKNKMVVAWDAGKQVTTLTHTTDFARGLVGLFNNPKAVNQDFHITTDEQLTCAEIVYSIGEAIGKKPSLLYVPVPLLIRSFENLKSEIAYDKCITRKFDNSKIKAAVPGWSCKVRFKEGINDTINYYRDHPGMLRISRKWNEEIDYLVDTRKHFFNPFR